MRSSFSSKLSVYWFSCTPIETSGSFVQAKMGLFSNSSKYKNRSDAQLLRSSNKVSALPLR